MNTNRIEAFSDGVFSIVITLLILSIAVPEAKPALSHDELAAALLALWPKLASFVVSFVVVGIYWVGHHNAFHHIKRSNRGLLWLNNFFLLCVVFIPFPAALLGSYLTDQIAVVIYGAILVLTGIMLGTCWWYATSNHRLVSEELDPNIVAYANRLIWIPAIIYAVAIVVSFISVGVTLLIYLVVPLLYIVPSPFLSFPKPVPRPHHAAGPHEHLHEHVPEPHEHVPETTGTTASSE